MKKIKRVVALLLAVIMAGGCLTAFAEEQGAEKKDKPDYDAVYLSKLLQSAGVGYADNNGISTFAAVPGTTVNTSVLDTNISAVDVVDYNNGSTVVESWAEGLLGADGEWAFCADPTTPFQSGNKTVYNMNQFYNQSTIDTIGCALAWYDSWKKTIGCTYRTQDDYMYKQILIWQVLKEVNGWYPGLTLEFGNNVKCQDGNHYLSNWTWQVLQYGIEAATDPEFRKQYECSGVIMKGEGQDLCQITYAPAKGYIEIQKSSANPDITNNNSCYSLAGAKYGVYKGSSLKTTLVTDAQGKAKSSALPVDSYTVKEIEAPKGFALDTKSYNVSVTSSNTTVLKVSDIPQNDPISILLGKIDSETDKNKPQGSASLENAEFTVKYYDGFYDTDPAEQGKQALRTWVLKTDETGYTRLVEKYLVSGDEFYKDSNGFVTLPLGTITIQETKPPEGYLLNNGVFIRQITSEGFAESVETYNEPVVKEEVIKGDIQIAKYGENNDETEDSDADIKKPLKDIKFHLESKTTGKVYTIVTDEQGIASTTQLGGERGNLPYDTYIVSEESPYSEYDIIKPFEVTVSEEGKTLYYIIRNDTVDAPLTVQKIDETTGKIIPVAGAKFQILDENKEVVSMTIHYPQTQVIDTFETDESGSFMLPEKLEYGQYYLKEVQAPEGYLFSEKEVPFTIQAESDWESLVTVQFSDMPAMGRINIKKVDAETGKVIPVKADFKVTAAEDIVTPDGTIRYKKDEVVDTVSTGEDGTAQTKDLYLGLYEVKEVNAPAGYLLSSKAYKVKLTYENQNTPIVYESVTVKDSPAMGQIQIIKEDSETGKGLAGAEFTVTALENIVTSDGTIRYEAGETVDTIFPGTNGGFSKSLYLGRYAVQETKAPEGYVLNDTVYEIELTYKDQYTNIVYVTQKISDNPAMGKIKVTKTDSQSGDTIRGTVFEITAAEDIVTPDGTLRLKKGEIADTITTGTDGTAESKNLYLGKYAVKERQQTPGFVLDDTVYEVELKYKDQTTEVVTEGIQIENESTSLIIKKVDKGDNETTLKGVKFKVWYKESAEKAEETPEEEETEESDTEALNDIVSDLDLPELPAENTEQTEEQTEDVDADFTKDMIYETDENGEIRIDYLLPDSVYCVQEVETLPGYVLDDTVHEITVDKDGTIKGEAEYTLTLVNDYTKVDISKQDSKIKKELDGAKLVLDRVKEDGSREEINTWTSNKKGSVRFTRLPQGEYVLTELEAPEGYKKAKKELAFTVEDTAELQEVVLYNDRITTVVKTGDTTKLLPLLGLLVISGGAAGVLFVKKRKGEK